MISSLIAGLAVAVLSASPTTADTSRLQLRLEPDQARATLDLLVTRAAGHPIPDSLWIRLTASEGFRRVMERERGIDERFGLDRGIDEAAFRAWLESDAALGGLDGRRRALQRWAHVDLRTAGDRALAYLPASTTLRATIYPIVREQTNSFIWDAGGAEPAIFMHLDPAMTTGATEHTLAHELHHIGAAGACEGSPNRAERDREVVRWVGAFAEGIAVLAAAGGPTAETHPYDPPELRAAWAVRLDSLAPDMAELEAFFLDLLDGRLSGEEVGPRGMSFINRPGAPQGPFYTVGWHMASTVERARGRAAVVAAVCDPVRLLLDYQSVAQAQGLPAWSPGLIRRLEPLAAPVPAR